jgi:hypothetical protein
MLEIWFGPGPTLAPSAALKPHLTSQHQLQHLQALDIGHLDQNLPCPCSPCHHHAISLSGPPQHAPPCHTCSPHSPDRARHQPRRFCAPDAPGHARPGTPRRARARQSTHGERRRRARPRHRATSSRHLCPCSLHHLLRDVTTHRPDTAIGPRERRRRRPFRRRPPWYWPLPSRARARLSLVFNAIKRCVIARASPTPLRHRQATSSPVDASSSMSSSPRHGLSSLL